MRPHPGERPGRVERARRGLASLAVAAALAAPLTGCTGARYLVQAGCGQLDLSLAARPIEEATRDPGVPRRVRDVLAHVGSIKRFAHRHGLSTTGSYEAYADLDRPVAVWVVTAAEPLSFRLKTWSFPIAGEVPYLGWFARDDALDYADELREDGWDVDVRGAAAYSTLGWFEDPVLSTMISDGDDALGELADTVLHESVHATVYVPGQSTFNESVAEFVAEGMTPLYLDGAVGPTSAEKASYLAERALSNHRLARMHTAYVELSRLYASSAPDDVKLARKRRTLEALRVQLGRRSPVTNATLAQLETYGTGEAELAALLVACEGSWRRFLGAVRTLEPEAFDQPDQRAIGRVLPRLARAGCRAAPG